MEDKVTIIEHIPVELNLGQPEHVVGFASATKNLDSGKITLEIVLNPILSMTLEELAKIFELKALGFAGIRRLP
jgi:hypothetical protein